MAHWNEGNNYASKPASKKRSERIVILATPKLNKALRTEAKKSGRSLNDVVHEKLEKACNLS